MASGQSLGEQKNENDAKYIQFPDEYNVVFQQSKAMISSSRGMLQVVRGISGPGLHYFAFKDRRGILRLYRHSFIVLYSNQFWHDSVHGIIQV